MPHAARHAKKGPDVSGLLAANLDLADVTNRLAVIGACAAPLLSEPLRANLAEAARRCDFEEQPEAVGPAERRVYQRLASRQLPPGAEPFAAFARSLEALIARELPALARPPWTAAPAFNDLLVQRYPPGPYALTPHLDGKRFTGLAAIAVLEGDARFCVCADRAGNDPREIPAPPGHVIFMRAPGFGGAEDGRPFHCVLDAQAGRFTLGLRHNSRI